MDKLRNVSLKASGLCAGSKISRGEFRKTLNLPDGRVTYFSKVSKLGVFEVKETFSDSTNPGSMVGRFDFGNHSKFKIF